MEEVEDDEGKLWGKRRQIRREREKNFQKKRKIAPSGDHKKRASERACERIPFP
jgi:hypothetical protein